MDTLKNPTTRTNEQLIGERTQRVLASLLREPWRRLTDTVRQTLPDTTNEEQLVVVVSARKWIEHVLESELRPRPGEPATPVLADRLAFCWTVLRRAESSIRKQKKEVLEGPLHAVLSGLLYDMFPEGQPLHPKFVQELASLLRIEADGRFLLLLKPRKPPKKPKLRSVSARVDAAAEFAPGDLRRVVWWLILRRKDQYVCLGAAGVELRFEYLVGEITRELGALCSAAAAATATEQELVDRSINEWLAYGCLDGEHMPDEPALQREVAETFLKSYRLETPVYVPEPMMDPQLKERIQQLEAQIARYSEENKRLEDRLRETEARPAAEPALKLSPLAPIVQTADSVSLLHDALKLVDAKYSLDVLNGVQLGEAPQFGVRNLVSHLFYAFRKKGLVTYPKESTIVLHYDQSTLYECSGFSVTPGDSVQVSVVKQGWALKAENRLLPIRKAVLRQTNSPVGESMP